MSCYATGTWCMCSRCGNRPENYGTGYPVRRTRKKRKKVSKPPSAAQKRKRRRIREKLVELDAEVKRLKKQLRTNGI